MDKIFGFFLIGKFSNRNFFNRWIFVLKIFAPGKKFKGIFSSSYFSVSKFLRLILFHKKFYWPGRHLKCCLEATFVSNTKHLFALGNKRLVLGWAKGKC